MSERSSEPDRGLNDGLSGLQAKNERAHSLRGEGHLEEAALLFEEILEEAKYVLGTDHPGTLVTLNNLASIAGERGNLEEALVMFKDTYDKMKEALGDEHSETLQAMNNIAAALEKLGHLEEATTLFTEVLQKMRQALGDDHPYTLLAMKNTACVFGDQGELAEAEKLFREAIRIMEQFPGGHPSTIQTMSQLAQTLKTQGNVTEAVKIYKAAIEERKRVSGDSHPSVISMMNSIALMLKEEGSFTEAAAAFQEVLEKAKLVLGPEHTFSISTMNNLGLILKEQGNLEEATKIFQDVLGLRKRVLGKDHHDTIAVMNNLAITLGDQGKFKDQSHLLRETVEKMEENLGHDHPDTLLTTNNLACMLMKQEDFEKAVELLKATLSKMEQVLPEDHPSIIMAMRNLAFALKSQGNLEEGTSIYKAVYAKMKVVLGSEHESTILVLNQLSHTLILLGNLEEATGLLKEVVEKSTRVLGGEHPCTTSTVQNLAVILEAQATDVRENGKTVSQATSICPPAISTEDEQSVIASINDLALSMMRLGSLDDAANEFKTLTTKSKQVLGEQHPITSSAARNLSQILKVQEIMKKVERDSQSTEAYSSNHAAPDSECHPSGNSVEMPKEQMPKEQAPDRRLSNIYSTISAMHNLTAMHMEQSDFEDAALMSEEIFEKMKLILGEKHLDTLIAMNNVAVVKQLRGSSEEATAMFADLHEKIKVLPIDDDPRTFSITFSIMNNIANVLEKQWHVGKAAEVLTELVDRSKRIIGEEHPYTTSAVQLLAALEARSTPEKGKAVIQATDESHSTVSCDDGYGPEVIESYRSRESADVLGEQSPQKSLGKPTADRDIKGSERSVPPDGSAKQLEEDFKYDPLDKGHIRIAVVEPGTRDTLKVALYHGPIDYCAQTPYFALSYAWGDTSIKTDILCRDMQMRIGLNLHSALCRLRHPTQRVAVWADALCINQDDIDERTSQVGLMRDIYANAKGVFVWLGEEDMDSSLAFRTLRRLTVLYDPREIVQSWPKEMESAFFESATAPLPKSVQQFANPDSLLTNLRRPGTGDQKTQPPGTRSISIWHLLRVGIVIPPDITKPRADPRELLLAKQETAALERLFQRPWFHRIWVFQEVALAKEAIFLCGRASLSWDDLIRAATWLIFSQPSAIEGFMPKLVLNIAAVREALAQSAGELAGLMLHLQRLLAHLRWCEATDPRDKVYGLLGVANRTGSLSPDYAKDVATLYMEIVRILIAEHESLEILGTEKCSTSKIDIPSWATDWSQNRDNNQGLRLGDGRVDGEHRFRASGGRKPVIYPVSNPRELRLKGFVLDSIAIVHVEYVPDISDFLILEDAIHLLKIPHGISLDDVYPFTGEEATVAFQRVLCADLQSSDRIEPFLDAAMFYGGSSSTARPSRNERPLKSARLMQWFYSVMLRVTLGRHFFITERGYIGLAAATVQKGDSAAVLLGSDVPFILRAKDQAFKLIGECYLHGIMDGEAMMGHEKAGNDFHEIVLV